jgi:hypothetical protein
MGTFGHPTSRQCWTRSSPTGSVPGALGTVGLDATELRVYRHTRPVYGDAFLTARCAWRSAQRWGTVYTSSKKLSRK